MSTSAVSATVATIHAERTEDGEGYRHTTLIERSGLTYRQVDFYCRVGYLHAIGSDQPGSGQVRLFSDAEVRVAVLIKQLLDVGFTPAAAARYAREHVEAGRVVRVLDTGSVLIGARLEG